MNSSACLLIAPLRLPIASAGAAVPPTDSIPIPSDRSGRDETGRYERDLQAVFPQVRVDGAGLDHTGQHGSYTTTDQKVGGSSPSERAECPWDGASWRCRGVCGPGTGLLVVINVVEHTW